MPTLLQINVTANWGSTGKIAEAIGVAAKKHGWDSYIAYGRIANSSQSHLIQVGGNASVIISTDGKRLYTEFRYQFLT